MTGCGRLDISQTVSAVMIVLQIMQNTSLISSKSFEMFPIRIAAPLSTKREAKAPILGDNTITLLSCMRPATMFKT